MAITKCENCVSYGKLTRLKVLAKENLNFFFSFINQGFIQAPPPDGKFSYELFFGGDILHQELFGF
jgi:hypothetical protein